MTDRWRITVDDRQALAAVRRIELFMSDLRPFWAIMTRIYRGWMRQQFTSEGAFGGQRWAALTPAYAAQKQIRWPGRTILVASGAMRRAIDNPERRSTPRTLTLTFDSDTLSFHQDGTTRMVARPVVLGSPLPAAAEAELRVAAEQYAEQVVGRDLLHRF